MSIAPSRSKQRSYKVLPTTDDAQSTLSELSIGLTTLSVNSKQPLVDKPKNVQTGSLSRNEHNSWYFLGHGAVDALMALGPVLFLVVSGLCLGLNNQPISAYGEKIKAITLLSPTIFPIIYAAILGKMLRRIGLFKAERGTTLGTLERLVGCQSIFSTMERQVGLQGVDFLGVTILLAWLLSPLGGQSSLRLLTTEPLITTYNSSVWYYPLEEYPRRTYIQSLEKAQEGWPLYAPMYMSAVQTSRQRLNATMDLFGNVKIPDVARLDNYIPESSNNKWYYIANDTTVNYTSIFGIPMVGVPDSGNCSFSVTTHYWATNCTTNVTMLPDLVPWRPKNVLNRTNPAAAKALIPTFELRIDEKNSSGGQVAFEYRSRKYDNLDQANITSVNCSTYPLMVESRIRCRDRNCRVSAIRKVDRKPEEVWGDPSPLDIFKNISIWMPGADLGFTQSGGGMSELVEHWILNPDLDTLQYGWAELSTMNMDVFSRRLQIAINTFWDAAIGSAVRMHSSPDGAGFGAVFAWNISDFEGTEYQGEKYSCHIGLAVLTIAIALILFVAANVSMLLGLLTRTPDILGFVSIAARDNPYFKHHATSYLSGLETARALRDVRVRVGDVRSDADVGHIALATMDAGPKKLSWSRMYD